MPRHRCHCKYHASGRPMQETCRNFEVRAYGNSGARPFLPAPQHFCLARADFCAVEGLATKGGSLACPPAPAPITDHEATGMVIVGCENATDCATQETKVEVSLTVANVNFADLTANASLLAAFEERMLMNINNN